MTTDTVTIKVWEETRKLLRLISAMTGEQILEVAHRIARDEWERVQHDGEARAKHDQSAQDQTKPKA